MFPPIPLGNTIQNIIQKWVSKSISTYQIEAIIVTNTDWDINKERIGAILQGIVLINLGTPKSPEVRDVRDYLIEFLTDGRVIDFPWLSRQLLVRGAIVPKRVKESARTYKKIWTKEGSPLLVYGKRVQQLLQKTLGYHYIVSLGMRYQYPSISQALAQVKKCSKITIIPLFPQYASATTGSIYEEVMRIVSQWKFIPELRFINEFATHPAFINAFAEKIEPQEYDHILFSFHGLPMRQLPNSNCTASICCQTITNENNNCYGAQCFASARAIAKAAGITEYSVAFQSRLGKDPWMEPFTCDIVQKLAREGKKRIFVVCPSFICDCLETLYEIEVENKNLFLEAGGEELILCPSLNDSPSWIEALIKIIEVPFYQKTSLNSLQHNH